MEDIEPDVILSENEIRDNRLYSFMQLLIGGLIGIIGCIIELPYHLNLVITIVGYCILIYKTFITAIKQLMK